VNVHRLLLRLVAPIVRLVARRRLDDPWARYDYRAPLSAYGGGNRHEFAWYLEGESAVSASSLAEVQGWLVECEYVHDQVLFNEQDFWQHPRTFEQVRRGDCEDHALWAWRKLIELGMDADLVAGSVLRGATDVPDRGAGGHVWVNLRRDGETFVFETVAKTKEHMLRPLATVRDRYRPEFGVDREGRRFAFNGAIMAFRENQGDATRRTA